MYLYISYRYINISCAVNMKMTVTKNFVSLTSFIRGRSGNRKWLKKMSDKPPRLVYQNKKK